MKVWLDGALLEEGDARVPIFDHGFLVGDGVFETLRVYGGTPFALEEHLVRLRDGAVTMGIPLPPFDIAQGASEVLVANELGDARLRMTLTSGSGPPGLARGPGPPTAVIAALPLPAWPPAATAIVSSVRRDQDSPLAGVKTTSLADGVVALAEARAQGAHEALLLNLAGELCEATTANVFVVRDGIAATPPVASGCLAGITRDLVLGLGGVERTLSPDDLRQADEAFLTSSTREVQPLIAVDGTPVGSGVAGPVTRRLGGAYSQMVAARLA